MTTRFRRSTCCARFRNLTDRSADGQPHAFLVNFAGLVPHRNLVPSKESGALVVVRTSRKCSLRFLPFLGETQQVEGKREGDRLVFEVPAFDRGAVVWIEDTK
jgi:hypothetical protein